MLLGTKQVLYIIGSLQNSQKYLFRKKSYYEDCVGHICHQFLFLYSDAVSMGAFGLRKLYLSSMYYVSTLTLPAPPAFAGPYKQMGGILPLCSCAWNDCTFQLKQEWHHQSICCHLPSSHKSLIAFLHHQTVVQSVGQSGNPSLSHLKQKLWVLEK